MTKSSQTIQEARLQLITHGKLQTGVVNPMIAQSWQRSLANGVNASLPLRTSTLDRAELEKKRSKNRLLLTQAKPEIETLYEQIAHSHSVVALTDAQGIILLSEGQHQLIGLAPTEILSPGYSWSEQQCGTNAIGTAIMERQAIAVQGAEHFVEQLHGFSCYAVPIFGANRQLLGTLNVSNAFSSHQPHTLALVKMTAQLIENRIFRACHQGPVSLHFHHHAEFIGTQWEGIAVFSRQGKLLAINKSGLTLLEIEETPEDFQSIFHQPYSNIISNAAQDTPFKLARPYGNTLHAIIRIKDDTPADTSVRAIRPANADTAPGMTSDDPQVTQVMDQAMRVINQNIPILIQGETGVGKELMASTIHHGSTRAHGPLIAVNCASLPEGLIEAELFGYEEGAFTGARQKGSQGKIEQAHGGTLFLDEIGDMPLLLQTRLLRVLQDRSITPLGSSKAKKLDFAVISATNQKLQEKVAAGTFRKDLYYRLNGISLTLPPLRKRQDLHSLVRNIMAEEGAGDIQIGTQVLTLFERHPWPGNIRQLHNVLRTMLALADRQSITCQHLPPGFMEELYDSATEQPANADDAVATSIEDITNEAVKQALQNHEGNVSAAARALGMSRNRLYRKLKTLGLA